METKNVPIDDDFNEMLEFALRYAIGRKTYATVDVINYIKPKLKYLLHNTLHIMFQDIDEELERDKRMRWEMAYKKEWMELREAIRQEITARGGRTR
jgi:hypothetical protein